MQQPPVSANNPAGTKPSTDDDVDDELCRVDMERVSFGAQASQAHRGRKGEWTCEYPSCGRMFGTEQGLRQHIAAMHAPPGTWLCRICGKDCRTSQARTVHEKACKDHLAARKRARAAGGGDGTRGADDARKRKRPGPSTSRFRGVSLLPNNKWLAQIKYGGRNHHIGSFDEEEEAAKAYDVAAREHHGGTARTNFDEAGQRVVDPAGSGGEDDPFASDANDEPGEGGNEKSTTAELQLQMLDLGDIPADLQPMMRQRSSGPGTSRFRGVCRSARKGQDKWQAQISYGGTNFYLGLFDSEEEAAVAYARAYFKFYGADKSENESGAAQSGKASDQFPMANRAETGIDGTARPAADMDTSADVDEEASNRASASSAADHSLLRPKALAFVNAARAIFEGARPEAETVPCAFARLAGADFQSYMLAPSIVLGRISPEWHDAAQFLGLAEGLPRGTALAGVDCHLGEDREISKEHAVLEWSDDRGCFEITCVAQQGSITVDGQVLGTGQSSVLRSGARVQICSRSFFFLPAKPSPAATTSTPTYYGTTDALLELVLGCDYS